MSTWQRNCPMREPMHQQRPVTATNQLRRSSHNYLNASDCLGRREAALLATGGSEH
jgi:hypothetical protein